MAGYPRVTHPSATKLSKSLPKLWQRITPFDLHVLSTPPAFILSQDQTLDKKFLPSRTTSLAIPSVLTVFLGCLFQVPSPKGISLSQTVLWNSYESSGLHYCLVFKVLPVCLSRRNSDIISSAIICVKTFFILFKKVIPPLSTVEFYDSTFSLQLSTVLKNLYKISL